MECVLELRDVSKHYPSHHAVKGISLNLARGEFFSLLGPSGCGKTTTLRLVAGFEEPTTGEIRLNGAGIQHLKPYQRNVSTVFQNYALVPASHACATTSNSACAAARAITSATAFATFWNWCNRRARNRDAPPQLSGGEQQRVALARSLVLEPDVLLLDEPLSALDPNLRKQVRAELKAMQRRRGITFLFVTHDQEEALSMSDRLAVMNQGRMEQFGTPEEVYLRPRTRFVAAFLGAVNWFGKVGVRPESTRIARATRATATPPARPRSSKPLFLGNCVHVEPVLSDGEPAVAEISRLGESFRARRTVHLWWEPADELRFE